MSLTGGGAVAGVPLCVGSLALAANGVVTARNGVKSLSIVLCHWNDEPAAAASAPAESGASSAPASTAAQPAPTGGASTPSTGQTTTPGSKRLGSGKQDGPNTRTWVKCTGQEHHAISKTIHKELQKHKTLKDVYKYRDERFVTQAINKDAHKGYQTWHRDMEDKVVAWLKTKDTATPAQFEAYLRDLYKTDNTLNWRFPNGL